LTIEHRGAITAKEKDHFEQWIFGCDICQDVCPWNEKFSRPSTEPRFAPHVGNAAPSLTEWSAMTPEEFGIRFSASPVRRAKWEGLMRNIRIVLEGNGIVQKSV
jgi:epoxyqueuosine reductase